MSYQFKPKLIPTLAFIALFPVLINLGFWQWDRAQQKSAWMKAIEDKHTVPLSTALQNPSLAQYHRINIQGHFLPEPTLLLMHQSRNGVQGYGVMNLFQIKNQEQPVLVNRGFINKEELTNLKPVPTGEIPSLHGIIDTPKPDRFILGKNILDPSLRPLPVQRIDLEELEPLLGTRLLPLVILADQDLGDGLIRDWQISPRMPPEKHLGYAIQWFALALCLAIIYLFVNLKKRHS
jgi:surfeit locus 1 family protein